MHTNVIYHYVYISNIVIFFLLSNSKYPFSHCKKSVIEACFWHTVFERKRSSLYIPPLPSPPLCFVSSCFKICRNRRSFDQGFHPVFLPFFHSSSLFFLFLLNEWKGFQKKESGNMQSNLLFWPKNSRHSTFN